MLILVNQKSGKRFDAGLKFFNRKADFPHSLVNK